MRHQGCWSRTSANAILFARCAISQAMNPPREADPVLDQHHHRDWVGGGSTRL